MMNIENIINSLPFPIFSCNKNGFILYKNRAAIRHIGTMRKGSRIARYLLHETLPSSGTVAILTVGTQYPHALAVSDENEILFLAFSRLQYPDYEVIAESILDTFGRTPTEIFHRLSEYQKIADTAKQTPRMYTELLRMIPQKQVSENKPFFLGDMITPLFTKASKDFLAFGYRIQTHITEDFFGNAPIPTCRFDFVFNFGRMLYFMMKLSSDGDIDISLSSERDAEMHLLRFYTHAKHTQSETTSILDFFMQIAPECAAEIILMGKSEEWNVSASVHFDTADGVAVEYRIPYRSPTFSLRRTDYAEEYLLCFAQMFARIHALLKENSSSC